MPRMNVEDARILTFHYSLDCTICVTEGGTGDILHEVSLKNSMAKRAGQLGVSIDKYFTMVDDFLPRFVKLVQHIIDTQEVTHVVDPDYGDRHSSASLGELYNWIPVDEYTNWMTR